METNAVTFYALLASIVGWSLVALLFLLKSFRSSMWWGLVFVGVVSTLWAVELAGNIQSGFLSKEVLLLFELSRYVAWIAFFLNTLKRTSARRLPTKTRLIYVVMMLVLVTTGYCVHRIEMDQGQFILLLSWAGLAMGVLALVASEQLLRNIGDSRLEKWIALAAISILITDIGYYTYVLTIGEWQVSFWQPRAVVSLCAALMVFLGPLKLKSQQETGSELAFSRPVAFYSTSLSSAGVLILVLGFGGYYVKSLGGAWGTVLYSCLLFFGFMLVAVVFASRTARDKLKVAINKHLFRHKYDYRTEWLRLINDLSQPTDLVNSPQRAVASVQNITKSPGAALWLREADIFVEVFHGGLPSSVDLFDIPENSSFCKVMEGSEWVYIPDPGGDLDQSRNNEHIPDWMVEVPEFWLVLPLMVEARLIGFMMLTRPKLDSTLTWEDRDLLKTVGRELGYYLEHSKQHAKLIEAEQFQTFQKLSAFVMHDLKNLIAQQALVVSNAEKHKHNPEFVDDAMSTVKNSVERMQLLLKKLTFKGNESLSTFSVEELLRDSIQECLLERPRPSLRIKSGDVVITADRDQLRMGIVNLIKNAQEATHEDGYIDVVMTAAADTVTIDIEDNGVGMDEDFIRNRLFRPFDTTKSGKGMGIGAHLVYEYVTKVGGRMLVESRVGEGTTFSLVLPAGSVLI